MNLYYCKICNISCPSDYQYQQHINGRKHSQMIAGGGGTNRIGGICFQFQNTGWCSKPNCTYKHIESFVSQNTKCKEIRKQMPSMSVSEGNKRTLDDVSGKPSNEIVSEYVLYKNVDTPKESEQASSNSKGDAFSLMMSSSVFGKSGTS